VNHLTLTHERMIYFDNEEDEDEYDQLPPFKPLKKSQLSKLSKKQKKAYFDKYDYREEDDEGDASAPVAVLLPDMALPPSFDSDNHAYRFRFLELTVFSTDGIMIVVIMNGDAPTSISAGAKGPIPPKTAEQKLARKNELKAKNTLLLAIPDEHLLKFHGIKDAKSLWEAIKNRFGGNKESKKMQKTILKQNYENFVASRSEGLDKTYESLPSAWNNIALIMRNKSDLDTLSMDDLYNNLKVYEAEIKGQSSSSLNSQNVAFVSSENTSSTNEAVNTAHDVSAASSQGQASSSSYADDVMFSFFANQSNSTQLNNEDLEQIDTDDLEEMDLKCFDKTKVECYNCHMRGHFARECRAPRNQGNRNGDNTRRIVLVETSTNGLIVTDGMGYDWSYQAEEGPTDFALMAYTSQGLSSLSSSDSECEALNKSNLEIIGYQMGLESLEARIVVHEKNEAVYEENIAFLNYGVQVKDISIKELKNQLDEALKEKDDLKIKLENQMNESEVLDNVLDSVFDCHESDGDNNQVNDRFKKGEGYHAVPSPYTGNYMPPRADLSFVGLDDSVFKSTVSETITSVPENETTTSKTSKDGLEKSKTFRSSAPLIEEWESDSEDENAFKPKEVKKIVKPSFKKIEFVSARNTTVEKPKKFSQSPRDNKRNRNGLMTQRLRDGFKFIKKACFRVNHQNKLTHPHPKRNFVPTAIATKSGQVPVNAAKQRAVASISTARPVNTAAPKPKVNDALPTTYSYFKAHSPVRRDFNQKSVAKTNYFNEKVKTVRVNNVTTAGPKAVVSAAEGNGENAVKSSAC
ncbi:ribonuclease H-like domain-containing protein, partial [Tanacetum coccineum]